MEQVLAGGGGTARTDPGAGREMECSEAGGDRPTGAQRFSDHTWECLF